MTGTEVPPVQPSGTVAVTSVLEPSGWVIVTVMVSPGSVPVGGVTSTSTPSVSSSSPTPPEASGIS
ncbi:hypothetical protein, partial [Enterovibrio norvegicus]|uniref:hypothetical protein n=1 Tax=Enterovibrio norvegicus TaxID=188144 RepID=UPI0010BEDBD4